MSHGGNAFIYCFNQLNCKGFLYRKSISVVLADKLLNAALTVPPFSSGSIGASAGNRHRQLSENLCHLQTEYR
jgi:hypothetical protein